VKFIRFAEWRIEQTGQGVVAFITNHAYLDNPTFRGMRAHLLHTFQRLYIVNLHGNARRKERAPNGSPDENVFDIQQGVAILVAIRKPNNFPNADAIDKIGNPDDTAPVWYCDVWGSRDAKYDFLRTATLESIRWTPLTPRAPMYLFVPQDAAHEAEYLQGWRIPDIFPVHSVGIVTARDGLTIHRTPDAVWQTVCELVALEPEAARERFRLGKDVRDWSVARAQQDLREAGVPNESAKARIVPILYRPFDVRYTFYTGRSRGFHCMPRPEVMRHLLAGENVALITLRQQSRDAEWRNVGITNTLAESSVISNYTREIGYVFPLYEYPKTKSEQGALLPHEGREANLNAEYLQELAGVLGQTPVPESVLGYLYAVLHSPAYRARYAEFLKRDFPRVPLPPDKATFDALAQLGGALIDLHLLRDPALRTPSCKYPVAGDHRVERVEYDEKAGRVWINGAQYFEPVSPEVWAYRVGGYQVCHKWLDDRKGTTLSYDERLTYQRMSPRWSARWRCRRRLTLWRVGRGGGEIYKLREQRLLLPPSLRFPPLREGNRAGRRFEFPRFARGTAQGAGSSSPASRGEPPPRFPLPAGGTCRRGYTVSLCPASREESSPSVPPACRGNLQEGVVNYRFL
jgi:predicted helicase